MNKCVITGEDTPCLTKNIPLSREGRTILNEKHEEYVKIVKQKFVERYADRIDGKGVTEEHLFSIAPSISKNKFLKMLKDNNIDYIFKVLESVNEVN
jgi:hypothetical protein